MSWAEEVDELNRRRRMAQAMGGPEGIARQRERGKLTARERVDALGDPGSFRETMTLVGSSRYEGSTLASSVPKPQVDGTVRIDGRKVCVRASAFTVRGGSGGLLSGLGRASMPYLP